MQTFLPPSFYRLIDLRMAGMSRGYCSQITPHIALLVQARCRKKRGVRGCLARSLAVPSTSSLPPRLKAADRRRVGRDARAVSGGSELRPQGTGDWSAGRRATGTREIPVSSCCAHVIDAPRELPVSRSFRYPPQFQVKLGSQRLYKLQGAASIDADGSENEREQDRQMNEPLALELTR